MGKPLAEALAEVDKCAWNCDVVADAAPGWLADHEVASAAARSWLSYEPLGVVFAVMPWNYPFWQVLRFACAALVAGNAAVLKHSPNVTGCALAIERLFADAGRARRALFTTLVLADAELAEATPRIIGDPRVAAVTLTGSERAGEAVGAAAGRALKKSVLELGGSDPFVVLDDADLRGRRRRGGEVALRQRRPELHRGQALHRGRARSPTSSPGCSSSGSRCCGSATRPSPGTTDRPDGARRPARRPARPGDPGGRAGRRPRHRRPPGRRRTATSTRRPCSTTSSRGMTTFVEETFGPVASIIRARDDDHAVELANDTVYGLGAAVWSRSERGLAVGRRIRSGALFVNAMVASDPRLPFGGIGRSGYGRELSAEGTREFTNVRTVFVGRLVSGRSTTSASTSPTWRR